MTAAELIKDEDRKLIQGAYEVITEFEPALQELIQAGFPFNDQWKELQDRKTWNRRMAEVFRVDLNTTPRPSTSVG